MKKKPSEKNKTWEKERRDRLNKAFDELAKLLPQYDPTVTWSKNEIIQKSITYISDLQKKHEKMLQDHDPKVLDDYIQLLDTLKFFRSRNSQLADLLNKAKITIPPAKFPKFIADNAHILEEPVVELKRRPVGRPKKNSNLENGTNNKKPQNKKLPSNKPDCDVAKAKSEDTLPADQNKTNTHAETNSEIVAACNPQDAKAISVPSITTPIVQTTNAIISTGVLIPVVACKPGIIPPIKGPNLIEQDKENVSQVVTTQPKCKMLNIQNTPHLNKVPKKLSKGKDDKVKILPYPVLKVVVRRSNNKVPIPVLKRDVVAMKKIRKRKRVKGKECDSKNFKKRRKPDVSEMLTKKNSEAAKIDAKTGNLQSNGINKMENMAGSGPANSTKDIQLDSLDSSGSTIKASHSLSIPDNELPDEYFTALDMPVTNPNSTSVSPTAAFLLSFPIVNLNNGGKTVGEVEIESGETTQFRNYNNNLSEGLENLNNFFSTKEYFKYCNQTCDVAEKVTCQKIPVPDIFVPGSIPVDGLLSDGKFTAIQVITEESDTASKKNTASINNSIGAPNKGKNIQKPFDDSRNDAFQSEVSSKENDRQLLSSIIDSFVPHSTSLEPNTFGYSLSGDGKRKVCHTDSLTTSQTNIAHSTTNTGKPSKSFLVSNIFQTVPLSQSSSASQEATSFLTAEIYSHTMPKTQHSITFLPLHDSTKTFNNHSDAESSSIFGAVPFFPKLASKSISNNIATTLSQSNNFPATLISHTSSDPLPPYITIRSEHSDAHTKSKSNFDVNAMLPHFSAINSRATSEGSNLGYNTYAKNVFSVSETHAQNILPKISQLPSAYIQENSILNSDLIGNNNKTLSYVPYQDIIQSNPIQQTTSNSNHLLVSPINDSSTEFLNTVLDTPNKNYFPLTSMSTLNATTSENTLNKNSNIKFLVPSTSQEPKMSTLANIPHTLEKSSILFDQGSHPVPNAAPHLAAKLAAVTTNNYPTVHPQAYSEFTFNLTSTTSTSTVSTAVTGQAQPYFTYSNVNQNLQWMPSITCPDLQTPFTFSLTSTTSSSSTNILATNTNSLIKSDLLVLDNDPKKVDATLPPTENVNSFPDINTLTSYSSTALAVAPLLPNISNSYSFPDTIVPATCYSTTNFTFSLAKQQVTTTTVSSDFMKPLRSCNATDQKFQPFYNTYVYDNYPLMSNDTTNFTFALTNPTQTVTSSKPANNKTSQRFSSSFSIDTTLGVSANYSSQQSPTTPQSDSQKTSQNIQLPVKINHSSNLNVPENTQAPSLTSSYNQNQEKQTKPTQKSHVNWMTSSHPPSSTISNQQTSYYPLYVTPTPETNSKSNFISHNTIEDNFTPWSPSKILDTSYLFQSTHANTCYDLNPVPPISSSNSKMEEDPPKQLSKTNEMNEKSEKNHSKSSNKSSQSKFFSVIHLVDQNTPNTSKANDVQAKKKSPLKLKDVRKNLDSTLDVGNLSTNAFENAKPTSTLNSYSAESLISKKGNDNQPGEASIHHLHNADFYPIQNDALNNSFFPQDVENMNYNSNYFYNCITPNQSYLQDIDYLGSYSEVQSKKIDCSSNRKPPPLVNYPKDLDKKTQPSTSFVPNAPLDPTHNGPSILPSVSTLDPFETFHYNGNTPNSGWNETKNMTGHFSTISQGIGPFGEETNVQVSNQIVTANSGNNITNFNLSTICPEISEKVSNPNNDSW